MIYNIYLLYTLTRHKDLRSLAILRSNAVVCETTHNASVVAMPRHHDLAFHHPETSRVVGRELRHVDCYCNVVVFPRYGGFGKAFCCTSVGNGASFCGLGGR